MPFGVLKAHTADDFETSEVRRITVTLRPTSRGNIIGQEPIIRDVLATIDRVANSMCTVLVTGESGTGKELVVAALHDASNRKDGPLITINCGAIPVELVESELFGHARGAFTGAQVQRHGHVANAEGGTLFLDEVGDLPMAVQVKLLRLLQQREYTPLGESRAVKCDVRIVAATNRDLEEEVHAGRFREDLYYRLNVIHVHLPPLRERASDVPLLAKHFFRRFAQKSQRTDLEGLSPSALAAIRNHPWPGNIRALENAVERAVLLARGPMVEAEDLITRRTPCAALEVKAEPGSVRHDPRREDMADQYEPRHAVSFARVVPEPEDEACPESITQPVTQTASVIHFDTPVRRASNPMFPRMLPDVGLNLVDAGREYQNNLIRQALLRTGGNRNRAAQLLGLNRTTLVEMIRRRGLGT